MIKYSLTLPDDRGSVILSLAASDPDQYAALVIEGEQPAVDWFRLFDNPENWFGLYGHMLGDRTTPADLRAAMLRKTEYKPELLEGSGVEAHQPNFPPGVAT